MLNRAAVLIGVSKTGGFAKLQAVDDGLELMKNWAATQGITDVTVLSDEGGRKSVSAPAIFKVIDELIEALTFEQLIVYFSGHGLNLGQNEYWLLSGFPNNPFDVVNVAASVERARTCPIPHVIFISDACRTPASDVAQAASLMSAPPIFPPPAPGATFKSVDVFYGTLLGAPALEVQDEAGKFHGVYTEALIDALDGKPPMTPESDPRLGKNVVRSWPLKQHLTNHLPQRLMQRQPPPKRTQIPDAVISSDPTFWVSAIDASPQAPSPMRGGGGPALESTDSGSGERSPQDLSRDALERALESDDADIGTLTAPGGSPMRGGGPPMRGGGGLQLEGTGSESSREAALFESTAATAATGFGRTAFESRCGFKVRGAAITEAFCDHGSVEIVDAGWESCRVWLADGHHFANVLLTFDNGKSVVLPAIAEFIAGLTLEDGMLIDIGYEPSENSDRWQRFHDRQDKLRGLRAVIAASTRLGTFQLEGDKNSEKVARDMQVEKGIDPSLGIYAAYAYRRQGNLKRLEQIHQYMGNDLGMVFFDIALLAGRMKSDHGPSILPPAPLLTQGWALLTAFDVNLPPELGDLHQHIDINSLWTLYDRSGARQLRDFLAQERG